MRRPDFSVLVAAMFASACVHATSRREAAPLVKPSAAPTAAPATAPAATASAAAATRQGSASGGVLMVTNVSRISGGSAVRDTVRPAPARPSLPPGTPRPVGDSVSAADVSRESTRVFGNGEAPPVADSAVAPGAPVWDIDVHSYETRKRVEDYVRIFSGRVKEVFAIALQRQTRYGPMIRDRLRRVGLPEDLTYLALVESWFNPHAYSRAAAVGFWQFMASTGRGMGLRVDWWVDERRDPVRSTEAAARLLLGLRDKFGSLYLAAAAYNGGDGRVARGLARYADALDGVEGEDRFFALSEKNYLRPETRDYVPKIIAAALVGEEPLRYGVHVDSLPPYSYDSVRVRGGTPLAAVANALGVEGAVVSELNPHLLRGMTPPSDSMWVRIPAGRSADFDERFSALDADERRALLRVESKKGQTMQSLAKAHGITAKQLAWYNPKAARLKSGALRAGQDILVPRRDVAALARDIPNPSIERFPRRGGGVKRHKVTNGQSLSGIATKYGVSVPTLMKLNGLTSERVTPGQTLVVSGRAASGAKSGAAKAATAKSGGAKSGAASAGAGKSVKKAKSGASKAGAAKAGAAKTGTATKKPAEKSPPR